MQPSWAKIDKSIGVQAAYNENSDSKDEDYPPQASKMKDLRYPSKPLQWNELRRNSNIRRVLWERGLAHKRK